MACNCVRHCNVLCLKPGRHTIFQTVNTDTDEKKPTQLLKEDFCQNPFDDPHVV